VITKDQAEVASEVLLQDGLAAQAAKAAKLARRNQAFLAFKWASVGVMVGYSLDEFFTNRSAGEPSPWIILAVAIVLAITTTSGMRKA
jgi:cytochrome bd-type quinol oxidase subunit 2